VQRLQGNKQVRQTVRLEWSENLDGTVRATTRVTGVLGYPVRHSRSPAMHNAAFRALGLDIVYVPFEVHPDNLEKAVSGIRALGFLGVNLTIPHKERVAQFLDWIDEEARLIGSVNTIHNVEGVLRGYSTDGQGFIKALENAGKRPEGSNAVVLGAGGAARATAYALVTRGVTVTIANRTFSRAVELAGLLSYISGKDVKAVSLDSEETQKAIQSADLLVNCTSVGMYPNVDEQPIPSEWLHPGLFVYDQIYNPLETRLIKAAKKIGAQAVNGVGMLVYQGAIAFEIWTGQSPPIDVMEKAVVSSEI
jgi:shikimate dehydrogenase